MRIKKLFPEDWQSRKYDFMRPRKAKADTALVNKHIESDGEGKPDSQLDAEKPNERKIHRGMRVEKPVALTIGLISVILVVLILRNFMRPSGPLTYNEWNKLVLEGDILKAKEAATYVKPPPPPPGTVTGYSPLMDQPRPTRIKDYLRYYEVLFIVDDSGSMKEDNKWTEVREALIGIAVNASELSAHTVSMRFMNDRTYVRGLKDSSELKSIFAKIKPSRGTPTGRALKSAFDERFQAIEKAVRSQGYSKIPPLDIIVLTDGEPDDKPADVIANAVKRLKDGHYHPNTMGVQFVQIGNDTLAYRELRKLVKSDTEGTVATVLYSGVVTSDMIMRILLGGMHPNVRALMPVDWRVTN